MSFLTLVGYPQKAYPDHMHNVIINGCQFQIGNQATAPCSRKAIMEVGGLVHEKIGPGPE